MAVKMTGIQRLKYFSMIGKDNPFKDVMLAEVISGNMTFSDPDIVGE